MKQTNIVATAASAAPLTQKISFMNNPQFGASLFAKSPVVGATALAATATAAATPEFSQIPGDSKNRKAPPVGSLQAQIAAAGIGPLPSDNLKPFTTAAATAVIGGGSGSGGPQTICVNPPPPMNLVGSGSGSANGSSGSNVNVNASSPQDKFFI